MRNYNAISFTHIINDWLAKTHQPRILHIFDHACNLINEHQQILSIVTPQIGEGPFNLVVENDNFIFDSLNLTSSISISLEQLSLGDLTIHTTKAKLWNPCPDWGLLHREKETIITPLLQLPVTNYSPKILNIPASLFQNLSSSRAIADISSAGTYASKLAGLGIGLTPTGDDFLMGAIYAAWIIHPRAMAQKLAKEVTDTAAPLTTSLSAAWLRSAGNGETGILWHDFFSTLLQAESAKIQAAMKKILAVGETSGTDALAGFIGTFISYKEHEVNYVIPKQLH